jgi:phosphate transport system substrate-binding protein
MRIRTLTVVAALTLACGGGDRATRTVLQNKGSDTLVNVAQAWAEAYAAVDPNLAVAVTGGGSGTGITAMINGTVDIANSSRKMRASEVESARANGQDPVEHVVGYDALAVYLHHDNPITELTLGQLSQIYGEGGTIETWDQLGVSVPGCSSGEIVRVSRQNNSGTYAYFQESVLGETEFKLGSRDMHGSSEVVELVTSTPCAIGYSGLAYATPEVKMPGISSDEGGNFVTPSVATAIDQSYPIARPLFMYTVGQPQGVVKQYMDWIFSAEGQCILQEQGYAPASAVTCG